MGIKIAPDVFQNVMSKLTQELEYVKTYLDDLLILTNNNFADHLTKLEMVLAERVSNQCIIRWKQFLRLGLQKPEKNYADLLV